MTVTSAGNATEVEVGSSLLLTATPDVTIDERLYRIVWSTGNAAVATVDPEEGFATELTGVSVDSALAIAEIKMITYVEGVETLISFDPPITDSIEIDVITAL